jgi:serine/threonine protein kinase
MKNFDKALVTFLEEEKAFPLNKKPGRYTSFDNHVILYIENEKHIVIESAAEFDTIKNINQRNIHIIPRSLIEKFEKEQQNNGNQNTLDVAPVIERPLPPQHPPVDRQPPLSSPVATSPSVVASPFVAASPLNLNNFVQATRQPPQAKTPKPIEIDFNNPEHGKYLRALLEANKNKRLLKGEKYEVTAADGTFKAILPKDILSLSAPSSSYDILLISIAEGEKFTEEKLHKILEKNHNPIEQSRHKYAPILIKSGNTYHILGKTGENRWGVTPLDSDICGTLNLPFPGINAANSTVLLRDNIYKKLYTNIALNNGHIPLDIPQCYLLEDTLLGKGGFGEVYQSKMHIASYPDGKMEINNDIDVAIKSQKAANGMSQIAQQWEAYRQNYFLPVHTIFVDNNNTYTIMERAKGTSLDKVLLSNLTYEQRMQLALAIAGEVQGISTDKTLLKDPRVSHSSIVHRDLKPANIMVDLSNKNRIRVRIIDFGIAVNAGEKEKLAGSLEYIAPESTKDSPITIKNDIYALSAIFGEIFGTPCSSLFKIKDDSVPEYKGNLGGLINDNDTSKRDKYFQAPYCFDKLFENIKMPDWIDEVEKGAVKKLLVDMSNNDPAKRPTIEEIQKFLIDLPRQWELNKQVSPLIKFDKGKFSNTNSDGIRKIIEIADRADIPIAKKLALIKKEAEKRIGIGGTAIDKACSWWSNSHKIGAGRHPKIHMLYQKFANLDLNGEPEKIARELKHINKLISDNSFVSAAAESPTNDTRETMRYRPSR